MEESQGFTQVPNCTMDIMMHLQGRKIRILLSLLRLTAGFHRESVTVSLTKLQEMTTIHKSNISKTIKQLVNMGLVSVTNRHTYTVNIVRITTYNNNQNDNIIKPTNYYSHNDNPHRPIQQPPMANPTTSRCQINNNHPFLIPKKTNDNNSLQEQPHYLNKVLNKHYLNKTIINKGRNKDIDISTSLPQRYKNNKKIKPKKNMVSTHYKQILYFNGKRGLLRCFAPYNDAEDVPFYWIIKGYKIWTITKSPC